MNRQSCAPWTEEPQEMEVFAGLPAVLRLLRLEAGASPARLDEALELPRGSYAAYERALNAPLLGTLDRILVLFDEKLWGLQGKLEAMRWIDWPPGGGGAEEEQSDDGDPLPSAEDFRKAFDVIRNFEGWPASASQPREHRFESFAEALGWLRGFFGLSPEELAGITSLSARTIRILEAGARNPRRDTRSAIGRWLQPLFNQKLIAAGNPGVGPFWNPPHFEAATPEVAELARLERGGTEED
jgi:transcriptional regulator with XRE-family HTH domain